jgi:hypothetical protein
MDLREIGWGGMDYINLARDRDQWRAHLNTVMNLRDPYMSGISSVAERRATSPQGHSSMELVHQLPYPHRIRNSQETGESSKNST